MEIWKVINGFPNYSVSNEGRVKNNKTGRILSPCPDSNGYLSVGLYREGHHFTKRIHKLVAEAFIPNPLNLPEINHQDGNKNNCRESNLEWCTRRDNILHNLREIGNFHKGIKRPIECVETGEVYPSVIAAAKAVGRSSMAIRKVLYGWTRTAAGQHWRYLYDCENGSDPRGEGYDLWLCKSRWEEYFGIPEE